MEWVLQLESPFMRAEHRRKYVRGKRADREALFEYRYRPCLNQIWGDAMRPSTWERPALSYLTVDEVVDFDEKTMSFIDDAEFLR